MGTEDPEHVDDILTGRDLAEDRIASHMPLAHGWMVTHRPTQRVTPEIAQGFDYSPSSSRGLPASADLSEPAVHGAKVIFGLF